MCEYALGTQHMKGSTNSSWPLRAHSVLGCKRKYSMVNAEIKLCTTDTGRVINSPPWVWD